MFKFVALMTILGCAQGDYLGGPTATYTAHVPVTPQGYGPPVYTKAYAAAPSLGAYANHGSELASYAATPSFAKYPAPFPHAPAPPLHHFAPTHYTPSQYAAAPLALKAFAPPTVPHYAPAPLAKSYATTLLAPSYPNPQVAKVRLAYHPQPSVGHVPYEGYGSHYGW